MITGADYNTPTAKLLEETDTLSVHQLVAYQTAVMAYKVIQTKKPTYIAERMQSRSGNKKLRGRLGRVDQQHHSLSIAKEGFIQRGASILNKLDECLRCEPKLEKFKIGVRSWVKENIAIKPRSKYPNLGSLRRYQHLDPPDDPPEQTTDIRKYFKPVQVPCLPHLQHRGHHLPH